ncbi:Uncharacterized protein Adt_05425 [Abeliophyllum distichum]|uniref:Ty3-gypsy retrotransposon protein n=1 Tax=Abeliophyllum distichum TaxID=126358 RepID=A0ABD1V422_9LAMI
MPHSFEELATRAHDLELHIARHKSYLPSDVRDKKDPKKEIKRDVKEGKPKEAMTIFTVPAKITFQKSGSNLGPKPKPELRPNKVQVQRKGLLTLKELEEKEYPFSDSEISGILDQLIEQKIIELPEPKKPEEAGQVDHPKYCRFHQIISHPEERCFVLKDLIVRLDKENKIKLETGENPTASCSMVSFGSFDPISISNEGQTFFIPYDAGKSLSEVAEFGPQLLKGTIPVELKVDEEVTITYVYPKMVKPDSGNRPTFYEIMTNVLDVWNSDSESEDEIGDGWSTFISKKEKYQRSNETGKKSSYVPLAGHTLGTWSTEVQSIEEIPSEESQGAWTLVKMHHQKAPQLPSRNTHDEKPRSRRKLRNNQRRKTKIKARANVKSTEMEATSRPFLRPVTLEEYFPKSFFDKQCFTSNVINADRGSESKNIPRESSKTRKVISQLSNIPYGTSLADTLNLSFDDRMALIAALIYPEAYQGKVLEPSKSTTYQDYMATITFNDDDLQLGSRLHNRPLYVSGYIRECKLHRIMIDCGSAVNIMPIKIMKKIGINVGDLSKSNIMIQGFNQKGQRAIGMIRLKLQTGELNSLALFHVIDAKTSYELLLGRVWRHETGVVPSTWHQCFKYSRDGEVKFVVAESKPFLKEKSYFADAKFYSEDEDFYSTGSIAGFEIKKDTNNDQRLIVVPPHQLMTGRSKITCGELSKGKQPQMTLADVKVWRKELTFPIPNIPKLALPYQLVTDPETSKVSTSIPSIEKLCISNSSKQNMPHVKEVEDLKQTF